MNRILHRYPVITPDPKPWESAFFEVQNKIENEHRELLVKELESTPDALLIEDRSLAAEEIIESMPFKPASRVTEAGINALNQKFHSYCLLLSNN